MANYINDLREDLASANDAEIQQLSHEVMEIQDQILDLDEVKDKGLIRRLEADSDRLNNRIERLRGSGR